MPAKRSAKLAVVRREAFQPALVATQPAPAVQLLDSALPVEGVYDEPGMGDFAPDPAFGVSDEAAAPPEVVLPPGANDCVRMVRGDQEADVNLNSIEIMSGLGWKLKKKS